MIAVVVLVALVLVSLIVVLSFLALPLPATTNVHVTHVHLTSRDNACGLNGANEPGFTVNIGTTEPFGWGASSVEAGCTVHNASSLTSGFFVLGVTMSALNFEGQSLPIVEGSVTTPAYSYSGVLNIDVE